MARRRAYNCPACGKTFSKKKEAVGHATTMHPKEVYMKDIVLK